MGKQTTCPYTPERLREIFWIYGWSQEQIAKYTTEQVGVEVKSHKVVGRWLRQMGISKRSRSEAQKVMIQRDPQARKRLVTRGVKGGAVRAEQVRLKLFSLDYLNTPANIKRRIKTLKIRRARRFLKKYI